MIVEVDGFYWIKLDQWTLDVKLPSCITPVTSAWLFSLLSAFIETTAHFKAKTFSFLHNFFSWLDCQKIFNEMNAIKPDQIIELEPSLIKVITKSFGFMQKFRKNNVWYCKRYLTNNFENRSDISTNTLKKNSLLFMIKLSAVLKISAYRPRKLPK